MKLGTYLDLCMMEIHLPPTSGVQEPRAVPGAWVLSCLISDILLGDSSGQPALSSKSNISSTRQPHAVYTTPQDTRTTPSLDLTLSQGLNCLLMLSAVQTEEQELATKTTECAHSCSATIVITKVAMHIALQQRGLLVGVGRCVLVGNV